MTTIHVQEMGEQAVLPRSELDQLVELARRSEEIELRVEDDATTTGNLTRLAETGGSLDFWLSGGEDVYSLQDGEPV